MVDFLQVPVRDVCRSGRVVSNTDVYGAARVLNFCAVWSAGGVVHAFDAVQSEQQFVGIVEASDVTHALRCSPPCQFMLRRHHVDHNRYCAHGDHPLHILSFREDTKIVERARNP